MGLDKILDYIYICMCEAMTGEEADNLEWGYNVKSFVCRKDA